MIYNEVSCYAYMKAMTPTNICNGFKKCGISPFDREVFEECDFQSSFVTDRPLEATRTNRPLGATSAVVEQESSPLPALPKAPPRKSGTKRVRAKTTILTQTPEKITTPVAETSSSSLSKVIATSKRPAKRSKAQYVGSESEDSDIPPLSSDTESPDTSDCETAELSTGQFVIVKFVVGKNSCVHYVGEVVEVEAIETDIKVDFYRKKRWAVCEAKSSRLPI